MKLEISIVPATEAHARILAPLLRAGDRAEIEASGSEPCQVLCRSVTGSLDVWTAFYGDEIVAMWGIAVDSLIGNVAQPWLMTTPLVERNRVRFMREARDYVETKGQVWKVLHGYTDVRYEKAIKLLRWLGFRIEAPNARTWPFVEFSRGRD